MLENLRQYTGPLLTIMMQKKKYKKCESSLKTGRYDKNLAKHITGLLELAFQGMLEDIDTKEKTAHPTYKDMEQLDCQILLTENYYVNRNSIHICFQIKIEKNNKDSDIDGDLITVNNFFPHWVKEISLAKYGSDKELIPTFPPYEIYQYAHSMLKHLPEKALKTIQKTHLYSKKLLFYADMSLDRRNHNGDGMVI